MTLTPLSKASSFIGMWPWSWYMHTSRSDRRRRPRRRCRPDVGRSRRSPPRARSMAGTIRCCVLIAEQTVLARVWIQHRHGNPRRAIQATMQLAAADDLATRSGVTRGDGLERHMGLTCTMRRCGPTSSMVKCGTPQRSVINSVWPTNPGPVSCVASLFIGIVTMPATRPARASVVAESAPGGGTRSGIDDTRAMIGSLQQPGVDDGRPRRPSAIGADRGRWCSISTRPEQFRTVPQYRSVAVHHGRRAENALSTARSTISGPTPEASPIVIATRGRVMRLAGRAGRRRRRTRT